MEQHWSCMPTGKCTINSPGDHYAQTGISWKHFSCLMVIGQMKFKSFARTATYIFSALLDIGDVMCMKVLDVNR